MTLFAAGKARGVKSALNQTTTPLTNGSTFTGPWELNDVDQVMVSCKTDQSGVLYFDFSNDETNVDTFPPNGKKVSAGIHKFTTAVKGSRYFRVRFTNDSGSDQTYLRLYTYFGDNYVPANTPLNQSVNLDQDATVVRPTIAQDEIRIGRRSGVSGWTKWGKRLNLTAASGEETVWTASGNYTPPSSASTYTIAYNNATDGLGQTGALTLAITDVDENGLPRTFVHTLGNTGSDVTTQSGFGINRIAVSSNGGNRSNANDITVTATTGGATLAHVPAGESVTQQAIYHVGANHDAVAKFLWGNVLKLSGGGNPRLAIRAYAYNRNIDTTFVVFECNIDTQVDNFFFINEPIGFNLSPTDVLYFVADTDTNGPNIKIRFSLNEYQRT